MSNRTVLHPNFGRNLALATATIAALAFLLVITMIDAPSVRAQSTLVKAFDVTSVKRLERQGAIQFPMCAGGRFIFSGLPMMYLFEWAYDAKVNEISGAPGWLNGLDNLYQIEAKSDTNLAETQCKQMAQELLADRFHLKSHSETKETAAYDLVIGKNGPKVRPARPDGPGVKINGAGFGVPPGAPKGTAPPKGLSMTALASMLAVAPTIGRPVVDKTALQGAYEFEFDYARLPGEDRPDVFGAVQDQLGLKLEPSKTQIKILVIEFIDRPTEN